MMLSLSLSAFAYLLGPSLVSAGGLGQWGPLIKFPLVPAAGAHTADGKILTWSAYSPLTFNIGVEAQTITATYDPTTGQVSEATITNTGHDMFCPGISMDFNGKVVVTGGDTASQTSIYSPTKDTWAASGKMNIGRGYQSTATLSNGDIFVIGGSWSGGQGGKNGEIFNGQTWSKLTGCPVAPMLTNDAQGIFRQDNHAWLFGWKNGFVFQGGPSKAMNWYGTSGTGSQTAAGNRGTDGDRMTGSAVMYDAVNGKIFTAGGSPSYQNSNAVAVAQIITIGQPNTNPTVQTINPMYFARAFHNSVVLPDGKVFITGGQTYAVPFSDKNSILTPEMWDPATTNFVKMASNTTPRNYHSIALLMPDGTVFSGGGGLCGNNCASYGGANHEDGQFYSPPYLFEADGVTRAARPVITAVSSASIKVGGTLIVTVNEAVTSFSMIRMSTTTHTVNTDQRRVAITAFSNKGLVYTFGLPNDAGILLPGYWMLFAINSAGVPSVAKTVLVTL